MMQRKNYERLRVGARTFYSDEEKRNIKNIYMYSLLSVKQISFRYNIPETTVSDWCSNLKRIANKVDKNMVLLIEELIGMSHRFNENRWSFPDIEKALNKYYGVNENNFYSLKSKV